MTDEPPISTSIAEWPPKGRPTSAGAAARSPRIRPSLRRRQEELEQSLLDAPSATWPEAAEKARYLITLFAETLGAQDRRRQKLIASALDDLDRLSRTAVAPPDA